MVAVYKKSVLPNGLRLVTEQIDASSSVSLGIWVSVGSRDEGELENGLAHLIEHMVFKGTQRRDKLAIAGEIDRLGGQTNAFTTKEHTCYHTRVRPEHLSDAVDLLLDIFQNSLYDDSELSLEKQVIQQEIAMVDDEPEELVHDLASSSVWPEHPLGRPVAGTFESVENFDRKCVSSWIARHHCCSRLVISAAGAVEHERLLDLLSSRLRDLSAAEGNARTTPITRPGLFVKKRRLEQAHLVVGSDFPAADDSLRHAASILCSALGGNMSSRLFQEIRERRALAYSVYSYYSAYQGIGRLEIYAGASPDRAVETRDIIFAELEELCRNPIGADEFARAVDSLATCLILSGESMESRMSRLGKNELIHGRHIELDETLRALRNVTSDDLQSLAQTFWPSDKLSCYVLGQVKKSDFI